MGFWSALTGSDSGSTTETTQHQTQTTDQKQTQTGKIATTGSAVGTTLDAGTIDLLTSLSKNLAGGIGGTNEASSNILNIVNKLVAGADNTNLDASIKSGQDAAKRSFATGEGASIRGVQQQIGSRGNSYSMLLENQGQVDLATMLAQIDAQTRAQFRQQNTQDLTAALSGSAVANDVATTPLKSFLSVIQSLTGARTTQDTSSTQVQDLINKLTGTTTADLKSQSHTSSEQSNGLIPSITSLFGGG